MAIPLTAQEILTTARDTANRMLTSLDEAEENAGPGARIANAEIAFTNLFTAGLVQWRNGFSPVSDFRRAIDTIDSTLAYLSMKPQSCEVFKATPTYLCCLVCYLMDGHMPARYIQTLPLAAEIPGRQRKLQDVGYLILLVWSLLGRCIPPEAVAVAQTPRAKRALLAKDTFGGHLQLLRDTLDGTDLTGSLRLVDDLYERRRRSAYYEGGLDYWGGGPMNQFVVDFQAAAVLRLAEIMGREIPPTSHRWRWPA